MFWEDEGIVSIHSDMEIKAGKKSAGMICEDSRLEGDRLYASVKAIDSSYSLYDLSKTSGVWCKLTHFGDLATSIY